MTTAAEPATTTMLSVPPRCEARTKCRTHGVERCPRPASVRLTVMCDVDGCGCAATVLMLCTAHADDAERHYGRDVVVRRSL
jgi:hypothetical protein